MYKAPSPSHHKKGKGKGEEEGKRGRKEFCFPKLKA
jgi:hypothetical protein